MAALTDVALNMWRAGSNTAAAVCLLWVCRGDVCWVWITDVCVTLAVYRTVYRPAVNRADNIHFIRFLEGLIKTKVLKYFIYCLYKEKESLINISHGDDASCEVQLFEAKLKGTNSSLPCG